MNNQETNEEVARAQAIVLGEDLQYLRGLPQFQRVILDGYITETLLEGSKDLIDMNPAVRQATMESIMSVNYLVRHLEDTVNNAEIAQADIRESEMAKAEGE